MQTEIVIELRQVLANLSAAAEAQYTVDTMLNLGMAYGRLDALLKPFQTFVEVSDA